ncbi:hypothetical protein ACFODT_02525 [Vibrio zhugei]|uniref:Uncharacterized protein n=1 Tax=Vibrio zhugei TaxID=2479546 RepID=A0ABV7C3V4_9VIBR|nr:hypothetical protein [Vibrio zhugei]
MVRFRRLIDFVRALGLKDHNFLIRGRHPWDELLRYAEIEKVLDAAEIPEEFLYHKRNFSPRPRMFLIKNDGTFFELRTSPDFYHSLSLEWEAFMELSEDTREIIVDALSEMRPGMGPLRYIREPFDYHLDKWVHQERLLKDVDDSDEDQGHS